MARILGIDYGLKRCGIAATDPLQIVVSAIDTIATIEIRKYIKKYIEENEVEKVVLGLPTHTDGTFTHIKIDIDHFANFIIKLFPKIIVDFQDESFSSVHAKKIILLSGAKKKKRRDKALIDKISAVVILQRYLGHI